MENGGKKIISLKLYACGSCENDLGIVFKGHKKEKRHFPAMVALIEHEKYGYMLYDTGYSEKIFENGIISFLYNLLNKATVEESQIITSQLKRDGINPEKIRYIILSHAHPDHIGALPRFTNYKLVSTKSVFRTMSKSKLLDLVFKNMKPDKNIRKYAVKRTYHDTFLHDYFEKVYDICGDGSIFGVALDGHAKGQLGIYIPEYQVLLAADACWGTDLLDEVPKMNPIPRLIQNNFKEYKETVKVLQELKEDYPEIEIVFTHQVGGYPEFD